jgi:hypothetical protein
MTIEEAPAGVNGWSFFFLQSPVCRFHHVIAPSARHDGSKPSTRDEHYFAFDAVFP